MSQVSTRLTIAGPLEDLPYLEKLFLSGRPNDDLQLGDVEPTDPVLRATELFELAVVLVGAGGIKALRDVLIVYLCRQDSNITLSSKDGVTISFKGPIKDIEKVGDLVERFATQKPPEAGKPEPVSQRPREFQPSDSSD